MKDQTTIRDNRKSKTKKEKTDLNKKVKKAYKLFLGIAFGILAILIVIAFLPEFKQRPYKVVDSNKSTSTVSKQEPELYINSELHRLEDGSIQYESYEGDSALIIFAYPKTNSFYLMASKNWRQGTFAYFGSTTRLRAKEESILLISQEKYSRSNNTLYEGELRSLIRLIRDADYIAIDDFSIILVDKQDFLYSVGF